MSGGILEFRITFHITESLTFWQLIGDRKDQKTLERLRAERQAKIDELKEKTNYYITQQLIQVMLIIQYVFPVLFLELAWDFSNL